MKFINSGRPEHIGPSSETRIAELRDKLKNTIQAEVQEKDLNYVEIMMSVINLSVTIVKIQQARVSDPQKKWIPAQAMIDTLHHELSKGEDGEEQNQQPPTN